MERKNAIEILKTLGLSLNDPDLKNMWDNAIEYNEKKDSLASKEN